MGLEIQFLRNWSHILSSNFFSGGIFFLALLSCFYQVTRPLPSTWKETDKKITGIVVKVKEKEKTVEIWIHKKKKSNLRIFLNQKKEIKVGDQVVVFGKFKTPKKNTILNGFNYKYYLWYHKEKVIFQANQITVIGRSKDKILNIKRKITTVISKRKNQNYLSLFLLGDSSKIEESMKESFRINGISHLFSISGMHFSLLALGISHLIIRKKKDSPFSLLILSTILFSYLYLIDFIPSAYRAFLLFELITFSKCYQLNWSKNRCFLYMISIILFSKPFYIFDAGFQFSTVLSFFLWESKTFFSKKTKIGSSIFLSILAFIISLPLTLNYYYSTNLLSILWNLILIPFVTIIFFPLQVLSFFFPLLSFPAFYLGKIFEVLSKFLSSLDTLIFIFHRPPWWWIVVYYIFLFLIIKNIKRKKAISGILLLIFILYHWNFLFPQSYFLMIDVGQGDSLLIHSNNQTMLVDTGGSFFNNQGEIYTKKLNPLLQSLGIRKIDILCLTHGDYDHLGEAYPLIEKFPIKKVYLNEGSFTKEEKRIINQLQNKKIPYTTLSEKSVFSIGKFTFFSLNKKMETENDSSIVLLGKIEKNYFLLMGDASIQTEKYIMENYELPKLLFLKVGHHGSQTSSQFSFLQKTKPIYSLISVGLNNHYGHPNLSVVNHLKEISKEVYMTSVHGSILIKFQKNVTFFLFPP